MPRRQPPTSPPSRRQGCAGPPSTPAELRSRRGSPRSMDAARTPWPCTATPIGASGTPGCRSTRASRRSRWRRCSTRGPGGAGSRRRGSRRPRRTRRPAVRRPARCRKGALRRPCRGSCCASRHGVRGASTYELDELIATKLRALHQRRKGRDLFDLWWADQQANPDPGRMVALLREYQAAAGRPMIRASEMRANLAAKRTPGFIERCGHSCDPASPTTRRRLSSGQRRRSSRCCPERRSTIARRAASVLLEPLFERPQVEPPAASALPAGPGTRARQGRRSREVRGVRRVQRQVVAMAVAAIIASNDGQPACARTSGTQPRPGRRRARPGHRMGSGRSRPRLLYLCESPRPLDVVGSHKGPDRQLGEGDGRDHRDVRQQGRIPHSVQARTALVSRRPSGSLTVTGR